MERRKEGSQSAQLERQSKPLTSTTAWVATLDFRGSRVAEAALTYRQRKIGAFFKIYSGINSKET